MNVVREIERINEEEIKQNVPDEGRLHAGLTEGDIICVFSQFGEIVDCNLIRDKRSGISKGFAFVAYEDQRSTILAVDNFNGAKLLGRYLRVDHVDHYRKPKKDINEGEKLPGDDDDEYEERRRQIWDYSQYSTVEEQQDKEQVIIREEQGADMEKQKDRIQAVMERRKANRLEKRKRDEELLRDEEALRAGLLPPQQAKEVERKIRERDQAQGN